jgi:hypothetical protein
MRVRWVIVASLAFIASSASMAQSMEYTKRLTGSLDISAQGRVSTYDLQTAGVPAIDQGLGSLIESWQFTVPANLAGPKATKADFVITLVRKSMSDEKYTVKRVEFFPLKASPKARRPQSQDELTYCTQAGAPARSDIICSAVLPADADLVVSAEVYVAIKKIDGEPQVSIESLNLYSNQNTKLLSKNIRVAKAKYSEAALAWAKKNSQGFLQDKDLFLTRVEYVQSPNVLLWRRQENVADAPAVWVNDDFRAKTKYISQGGLEVIVK